MTNPPFSLHGKVAVVTGANTGLGQAMAVALARAGASIALVGRSAPDDTRSQIAALGGKSATIMADLSDAGRAGAVIDEAKKALGAVDILVNNAGIIKRNDAIDFTIDDWDSVMATNLKVPFFLAQAAARTMFSAGGGGKIINVASLLSLQGGIRVASYTASKSGLAGITRLLANEWAGKGINVNAIVPGYFKTNNTEALRADPQRNREILQRIPAGRWGKPEDLGGAASNWDCLPAPEGDLDDPGGIDGDGVPNTGEAFLSCFSTAGTTGGTVVLGVITFQAIASGSVNVALTHASVGDLVGVEIATCPGDTGPAKVPCNGGALTVN